MSETLDAAIPVRTIGERLANLWVGYLDPAYPHDNGALLVLPMEKRVFLFRNYNSGHKIIVRGSPSPEAQLWLTRHFEFPTATMDSRRPVADLARDIKRRVIDELPPISAQIETAVEASKKSYEATHQALERLKADFAPLRVHSNHATRSSEASFTIYDLPDGGSIHGQIFRGQFTINRMYADSRIMSVIARELKQRPTDNE